jgi:hypothetical protein
VPRIRACGWVVASKYKGTSVSHGLDSLDDLERRAIGAPSDDDVANLQLGLRIDRLRDNKGAWPE